MSLSCFVLQVLRVLLVLKEPLVHKELKVIKE